MSIAGLALKDGAGAPSDAVAGGRRTHPAQTAPIIDVAVIGAGPVGLSIAAHLQAQGVSYQVFGEPMAFWEKAIPRGLRLKSEGFATSLSDPHGEFTLGRYCRDAGVRYDHVNVPIDAATFVAYGKAFQMRLAPKLDRRNVVGVEQTSNGFRLAMAGGGDVTARRVVVATGLESYNHVPDELQGAPGRVLHSAAYGDIERFAGKDVVVVGAGASAADIAAGLRRHGATVRIMTRRPEIHFPSQLGRRSLWAKLRKPMTSIGPGWKSVLCVKFPLVFHMMPQGFRNMVVRRYLGPAPAWFLAPELQGIVPVITDARIVGARDAGDKVVLDYQDPDGGRRTVESDYVIAATGFRVDMDRLGFLSPSLRSVLRRSEGAPLLSSNFESSAPGLYFVGAAAASNFGPMLRFVCGCHFTADRLGRHLAATASARTHSAARRRFAGRRMGPRDLIAA